jgi:membrane dipeptidase
VIQLVAASDFLVETPAVPELLALYREYQENIESYSTPQAGDLVRRIAAARHAHHVPLATFDDVVRQLLVAVNLLGSDHVGIGIDWDGGGGVLGFNDVTAMPKVTEALAKAGHHESDIVKIMGENVLRVLAAAESHAHRAS